jgi:hypothetical protein
MQGQRLGCLTCLFVLKPNACHPGPNQGTASDLVRGSSRGRSPALECLQGQLGEPATSTAIGSCRCRLPWPFPIRIRAQDPHDAVCPRLGESSRPGLLHHAATRPGRVKWFHFAPRQRRSTETVAPIRSTCVSREEQVRLPCVIMPDASCQVRIIKEDTGFLT